jgi:hypothetical protein
LTFAGKDGTASADLLVGQLVQRLVKALPPTGCRTSSHLRTFCRLVAAFADADDVAISTDMMNQLQVLRKAFFCVQSAYGDASGNQPLAKESLDAVEQVQQSSEKCILSSRVMYCTFTYCLFAVYCMFCFAFSFVKGSKGKHLIL